VLRVLSIVDAYSAAHTPDVSAAQRHATPCRALL
jgi:hypothetical protein